MKTSRFFFCLTFIAVNIVTTGCDDGFFSDCRRSNLPTASLEFDLQDVTSFDFALAGNVIVSQGATQQIVISGPEDVLRDINTNVTNGRWGITTRDCFRKYDPVTVTMQLMDLDNVSLSGAGNITIMDAFDTNTSRVVIAGSGNILWRSTSQQIESIISGSGDITLTGQADKLFGTVAGSGNILGKDFSVMEADMTIAGSGDAEVTVSDLLKVRIAGSGSVFYYGDPSSIDQSISGSGNVVQRE